MLFILRFIMAINTFLLKIGRTIAWIALAIMVAVILLQVIFRYVFNNALPWPDEAARFLMLWMTGLIAPLAYRHGGFVAIDMVPRALPSAIAKPLLLLLFAFSLAVLYFAAGFGWAHTMGFGGNFDSSSLKIPLDWFGGEAIRVKLRYMYMSLLVGVWLLILVSIELILRSIIEIINPDADIPEPLDDAIEVAGAD